MEPSTGTGLAAQLKQATRSAHAAAERSGLMVELLQGRINRPAYCLLLRNLHAIYEAMEAGLARHGASVASWSGLCGPALQRCGRLEADLAVLHAGPWRSALDLAPATLAYVARLQALARNAPELLLAHAYVRYLGDLYGGQVLGRLVREHFGLVGEAGTRFYEFGAAERVARLRLDFRAGLDALVLTPEQADAFVTEACSAFHRHQQLFDELAAAGAAL